MKFQIKNRWTGAVQYECELSAEVAGKSYSLQLGFAVRNAVKDNPDLRYADLRSADLRYADLSYADLRYAESVDWIPRIENIHSRIFEAASKPGAFDMGSWHKTDSCGTTHCRAGLVIALAGSEGRVLEGCRGTPAAAAAIYMASDPALECIPDFYCGNAKALADMKRLADAEIATAKGVTP